jgi:hypothetical protein
MPAGRVDGPAGVLEPDEEVGVEGRGVPNLLGKRDAVPWADVEGLRTQVTLLRRPGAPARLGRLVRVLVGGELERALERLLEVPLLDRRHPVDQLLETREPGALVQPADDRPVTDLAGLGHRQEPSSAVFALRDTMGHSRLETTQMCALGTRARAERQSLPAAAELVATAGYLRSHVDAVRHADGGRHQSEPSKVCSKCRCWIGVDQLLETRIPREGDVPGCGSLHLRRLTER